LHIEISTDDASLTLRENHVSIVHRCDHFPSQTDTVPQGPIGKAVQFPWNGAEAHRDVAAAKFGCEHDVLDRRHAEQRLPVQSEATHFTSNAQSISGPSIADPSIEPTLGTVMP
jgi:hypothetical protein